MVLYRRELSDGVYFNHLRTDKFKSGYFSINFLLPLAEESAAYYAILPRILCRGCKRYPDQRAIGRRLEELYGADISTRNLRRGDMQVIGFSLDVLDNQYLPAGEETDLLAESFALLREVLLDPYMENGSFRPEYIESERKNAIDTVRSLINNKHGYAVHRAKQEMCRGEAAGVSVDGRVEDYESMTPERLLFYYRHMLSTAHIEIFYVGSEEAEKVEALSSDLFDGMMRSVALRPRTEVIRVASECREVEETVAAAQGVLAVGFRTGTTILDDDYFALTLFVEIFGGSPSSKLFMNVRERLSLCYFCYATCESLKGILFAVAGIRNENRDLAKNEIFAQLSDIVGGNISEEEFQFAKKSLCNAYRAISDNPRGLENWYVRRAGAGTLLSPEEAIAGIEGVTVEDVCRVAARVTPDTVYFLRGINDAAEEVEDDE